MFKKNNVYPAHQLSLFSGPLLKNSLTGATMLDVRNQLKLFADLFFEIREKLSLSVFSCIMLTFLGGGATSIRGSV